MTIKEIEERSGIPRANIRYYETEGFLKPSRNTNGYRDYAEADLETLLRIKLLRSVHISLEDIKALQRGERELTDILNHHLQELTAEQKELEHSKEVCIIMRDAGDKYSTLNAQKYLDYMQRSFREDSSIFGEDVWQRDMVPREPMPLRRFLARSLDVSVYSALWHVFLMCVCNVNVMLQKGNVFAEIIAVTILMLVIEPVLLTLFGTTFGKWVLGLYVTNLEGEKPCYRENSIRTLQVLGYGLGWLIPIYHWIRLYRSYKGCMEGRDLEWEYRSNVLSKGNETKYILGFVLGCAGVFFVTYAGNLCASLPQYKGNITTVEFCKNFNRLAAYYGFFDDRKLLESGEWLEEESDAVIVEYLTENVEGPEFIFVEEKGVLTEVRFSESFFLPAGETEQHSSFGIVHFYQQEMAMAVLAFLPAQEEYPFYSNRAQELAEYILTHADEDFFFEEQGVRISYDLEYTNFENRKQEGFLMKLDDSVDASCTITFSMQLQ